MDSAFAAELDRLGPGRPHAPFDLSRARAYCRRLTLGHYENFTVASLLLPRRLLRHFHAVYAYCRWADDLADEAGGGDHALDLLRLVARGAARLLRRPAARTRSSSPCGRPSSSFRIPPRPFLDLLLGVRAGPARQALPHLRAAARLLPPLRQPGRPAGALPRAGRSTPERAVLSDRICTALQLANFWQDVARDLDIGRVYLPEEDRRRFGYGDDDLAGPPLHAGLRGVDALRGGADARTCSTRGWPLRGAGAGRPAASTWSCSSRGGLAILRKIEAAGYDVSARRPVLAKWEKGRCWPAPVAALGAAVRPLVRERRRHDLDHLTGRPTRWRWPNPTPTASAWPGARPATSTTPFACCRPTSGGPCPPSTPSCASPTTWPTGRSPTAGQAAPWPTGATPTRRRPRRRLQPSASSRPCITRSDRFGVPPRYLEDGARRRGDGPGRRPLRDVRRPVSLLLSRGVGGRPGVHPRLGLSRRTRPGHTPRRPAIAFQLTNILRDLGEDAGRGRVYLPREDLERFGYDEESLRRGVRDDALPRPDALRGGPRRAAITTRPSRWRRCCGRPGGRCS